MSGQGFWEQGVFSTVRDAQPWNTVHLEEAEHTNGDALDSLDILYSVALRILALGKIEYDHGGTFESFLQHHPEEISDVSMSSNKLTRMLERNFMDAKSDFQSQCAEYNKNEIIPKTVCVVNSEQCASTQLDKPHVYRWSKSKKDASEKLFTHGAFPVNNASASGIDDKIDAMPDTQNYDSQLQQNRRDIDLRSSNICMSNELLPMEAYAIPKSHEKDGNVKLGVAVRCENMSPHTPKRTHSKSSPHTPKRTHSGSKNSQTKLKKYVKRKLEVDHVARDEQQNPGMALTAEFDDDDLPLSALAQKHKQQNIYPKTAKVMSLANAALIKNSRFDALKLQCNTGVNFVHPSVSAELGVAGCDNEVAELEPPELKCKIQSTSQRKNHQLDKYQVSGSPNCVDDDDLPLSLIIQSKSSDTNQKYVPDTSAENICTKKTALSPPLSHAEDSIESTGIASHARKKIVVIGAGAAGLSAARLLQDSGLCDVTVLEARDYVGGRARSEEWSIDGVKTTVDVGASFIHGCYKDNPMWILSRRNRTKTQVRRNFGGYSRAWRRCKWYDARDHMTNSDQNYDAQNGVYERPRYKRTGTAYTRRKHKPPRIISRRKISKVLSIAHEVSIAMQDLACENILGTKIDDFVLTRNGRLDCGIGKVFDEALKRTQDAQRISLSNLELTLLESMKVLMWAYVANITEVSFLSQQQQKISPRISVASEHSLNTVPLHQTQKIRQTDVAGTEADMPDGYVAGGYGNLLYDEVFMHGSNPQSTPIRDVRLKTVAREIQSNSNGCEVLTRDGDILSADYVVVTVPLGVLKGRSSESKLIFKPPLSKEKQDAIRRLGYGVENKIFLHFSGAKFWPAEPYFQCTDPRFRFMNLDFFGKRRLLVAHVQPPYSMGYDNKTDSAVVSDICDVLQRMFELAEPPQPSFSHVTHWHTDEFAGHGSYSFMRVGATVSDVEELSRPEGGDLKNGPRIYFAGEACSVVNGQCVQGAYESGIDAANAILANLR